ncbi:alpha-amylase [Culturomica massiliensis]|jgi:alpha-amylase|uniref:alpha-amylase n=1 Tax=Culturomica massiliensis TaxID=1841857 RepID=UPI0023568050|nr:alpha-amylase [Culturomica massiliensis]
MKNGVMMQYFEWNMPNNGNLWKELKADAAHLHEIGVTSVWIPPAYKGLKQEDEGYGTYDLYDLGEFDQKGTVRTKYGTVQELKEMIAEVHRYQVSVYLDAVMNHKAGADYTEKFLAREVNPEQREDAESDPYEIEGWTGFNFPGRGDKYSAFKWHWYHFSGVDCDASTGKEGIFQVVGEGKAWNGGVDGENGNYDFLMFADLDFDHPEVVGEMKNWGVWVSRELNLDGMRLDAIKHINDQFIKHFLEAVRAERGDRFYAVGEYWKNDKESLDEYLAQVEYQVDLFDVPLHYHMFQASQKGRDFDLSTLIEGTLVADHPDLAVTFVDNHDSQKNSSLESQVKDWFKPMAYGLILLMKEGYPCIFYGDYYGVKGKKSPHRLILDILLDARRRYAFGEQHNYFDHPNTVGFTRTGDAEHPGSGLALLISNGEDGHKTMAVGQHHRGEYWYEITGNRKEEVMIDEKGEGTFPVSGGKLAVWVKR